MSFSGVLPLYISIITLFALISAKVEDKRGCRNYGHSCYGGVAKRQGKQIVYAGGESNYRNYENVASTDTERLAYQPEQSAMLTQSEYEQQPRIIRQWLQQYRGAIPKELAQQE